MYARRSKGDYMKSRTFFSAIALAAGALLLAGIIGFWGLTAQNPQSLMTKGGQAEAEAVQFVPRQAPVVVSLLARPDRLWNLRQLLAPPNQRWNTKQEWQSLKQSLTDAVGWNYDTDVRPWLDQEVTFAITSADLDRDPENGQQAGYLIVLSCRDGQQAREALHVLWQKRAARGRNLVFAAASGVSLIYDQNPAFSATESSPSSVTSALGSNTLASTIISDRYVLLANHPDVLRQALTAFQAPDVSIARDRSYQTALQQMPGNGIGWLYVNVPQLLSWAGLETNTASVSSLKTGRNLHHLFALFRAAPLGLLADTEIAALPGHRFQTASGQEPSIPTQLLSLVPKTARLAVTGHNLSHFLGDTMDKVSGYPTVVEPLQTLTKALSLPREIVPVASQALQDEYAVGLLSETDLSWFLIADIADADRLREMDELAQSQGLTVSHVSLGDDQDVVVWSKLAIKSVKAERMASLSTQIIGVHTQFQGSEVFSTSLSGLQAVLQTNIETESLSAQPMFSELLNSLDKTYSNVTYIDWPSIFPLLTEQFPWLDLIDQVGQPYLSHIGPLLISGSKGSQSLQEGIAAVKLLANKKELSDL